MLGQNYEIHGSNHDKFSNNRCPNIWQILWRIWLNITFDVKTGVDTFGQVLKEYGYILF